MLRHQTSRSETHDLRMLDNDLICRVREKPLSISTFIANIDDLTSSIFCRLDFDDLRSV